MTFSSLQENQQEEWEYEIIHLQPHSTFDLRMYSPNFLLVDYSKFVIANKADENHESEASKLGEE